MRFKRRLFIILLSAGLAGVFSFLLVDLEALLASLPVPPEAELPPITPAIKLLSLIQPAILLTLAVLAGVALAPKVGLSSPAVEAGASGGPVWPALKPQVVPGIVGGVSGGGAIIAVTLLAKPYLSAERRRGSRRSADSSRSRPACSTAASRRSYCCAGG